jgi:hypothetical protein
VSERLSAREVSPQLLAEVFADLDSRLLADDF